MFYICYGTKGNELRLSSFNSIVFHRHTQLALKSVGQLFWYVGPLYRNDHVVTTFFGRPISDELFKTLVGDVATIVHFQKPKIR